MNEFVVEYYDGFGYDGEPLIVADYWQTGDTPYPGDPVGVIKGLPPGAPSDPPSPTAVVTGLSTEAFGCGSKKLKATWSIPNRNR